MIQHLQFTMLRHNNVHKCYSQRLTLETIMQFVVETACFVACSLRLLALPFITDGGTFVIVRAFSL